jgi:hypothetical protein
MILLPYIDENGASALATFYPNGTPRALSPFRCAEIVPGEEWERKADWLWYDGERVLRFRLGYRWDGASVPWAFRWYEGKGTHLAASGAHDPCYQYHFVEWWNGEAWVFSRVSKSFADCLWEQILYHHYGVRISKARVLWAAVAGGGLWTWITDVCDFKCDKCKWSVGCPYFGLQIKVEGVLK